MKKIFIVLTLLVLASILVLQIDDDLDAEVQQTIDKVNSAKESASFTYLLGIGSAENEDPQSVGEATLKSIRKAENDFFSGKVSTFEYQEYPEIKKLPLPKDDLFCKAREEACLENIFNKHDEIKQVLNNNSTLIKRYQTFIKMNGFHTLTRPHGAEPQVRYSYILNGSRLVRLAAINEAILLNIEKAIEILTTDIANLRNHLKQADGLVGKMVYISQISENLDFLSLLIHKYNYKFQNVISPLIREERDFELTMRREFTGFYYTLLSIAQFPDSLNNKDKEPEWFKKFVFKPNLTANSSYSYYKKAADHSLLQAKEFAKKMMDEESTALPEFTIRNYLGSILNDIAKPNYNTYVARMFDLDAKIQLFNETANISNFKTDLVGINNPYYESGKYAYFSNDNKKVCFDGPLDNNMDIRCLRIKL